MARRVGASSRGFVPGLVMGLVVGAFAGAVLPPLISGQGLPAAGERELAPGGDLREREEGVPDERGTEPRDPVPTPDPGEQAPPPDGDAPAGEQPEEEAGPGEGSGGGGGG